jgi:hypothetical protein
MFSARVAETVDLVAVDEELVLLDLEQAGNQGG